MIEWRNPALARCYGKSAFPNFAIAEKVAQRDSEKAGELIIAYQCYDCGRFHVGHADLSQILARQEPIKGLIELPTECPRCGQPVPEERRIAATESGNSNVYCSKKCGQKFSRSQRHARKAAQLALRNEPMKWFIPEQDE